MATVGRWKLNEAAGSSRADESGNNNTLVEVGGEVSRSTGHGGTANTAASFDGTKYLKIDDASQTGLDLNKPFAIAFWHYRTGGSTAPHLLGKWDPVVTGLSYLVSIASNKLRFYISSNGSTSSASITSTTTVNTLNTWFHVMCIYTGTQLELYINNVSNATPVATTVNVYNGTADLLVGLGDPAGTKFTGRIDDLMILDHAPDATERADIYAAGDDFAGLPGPPQNYKKVVNETFQHTEGRVALKGLRQFVAETVEAASASLRSLGLMRAVSATVQAASQSLRGLGLVRSSASTVQAAESSARGLFLGLIKSVSEGLNLSSAAVSRLVSLVTKVVSEVVNISSSSLTHFIYKVVKVLQESVNMTTGLLKLLQIPPVVRVVGEAVQAAEAVIKAAVFRRVVSEAQQVQTAAARALVLLRLVGEGLAIASASITAKPLIRIVGEAVNITEAILRVGGGFARLAKSTIKKFIKDTRIRRLKIND